MLVLTRKVGEGIAIGDDIKIVVMQIKGKQVRLGIRASANTTVHREEVYQRILDENRAASQSQSDPVSRAGQLINKQPESDRPAPVRRVVRTTRSDDDSGED